MQKSKSYAPQEKSQTPSTAPQQPWNPAPLTEEQRKANRERVWSPEEIADFRRRAEECGRKTVEGMNKLPADFEVPY